MGMGQVVSEVNIDVPSDGVEAGDFYAASLV